MFGSRKSAAPANGRLYVEDVFSTYLYTGNGGTQTINNGIDLAGKGGMVWRVVRNSIHSNNINDSARGTDNYLITNSTAAQSYYAGNGPLFTSTGYDDRDGWSTSASMASWTFREAPKFFDVVTYTGNGVAGRQIAHSLGATPGCIIVKCTSTGSTPWVVWHRGIGNAYMLLNSTQAALTDDGSLWGNGSTYTAPTSTAFTVSNAGEVNASGRTYVAYLFAHDATADGVIQCGSFGTDDNGDATVNLGWEPQWVMAKPSSTTGSWTMFDTMRGFVANPGTDSKYLSANSTSAENSQGSVYGPTATGFETKTIDLSTTFVYIAIRRGPMRTPTTGTSVFSPNVSTSAVNTVISTGFPVDYQWMANRNLTENKFEVDRLRGCSTIQGTGTTRWLATNLTNAEGTNSNFSNGWDSTGFRVPNFGNSISSVYHSFRRAPGFFDIVCWTNNGSAPQNVTHSLGVVPELIITKRRAAADSWQVYSAPTGASAYLNLNTTAAVVTGNTNRWNATSPTASVFTTGSAFQSSDTYVAYLFASCPGVSKVGSYTGNGSSQTINCGFTSGARFVMIKRTDSTGDWWVWDTARGIVSGGNDPRLNLNTTADEPASRDEIDPDSVGFIVKQSGTGSNINASGASYIFMAVA